MQALLTPPCAAQTACVVRGLPCPVVWLSCPALVVAPQGTSLLSLRDKRLLGGVFGSGNPEADPGPPGAGEGGDGLHHALGLRALQLGEHGKGEDLVGQLLGDRKVATAMP